MKRITSPAAPGNDLALKHGAYSERRIAERAELVHERLLEAAPWVDRPEFMPSVARYIQATAREQLAHEALMAGAKLSPRLLEAVTAAARLAWRMGDELGLTPAGHARLKMLTAGGEQAEATLADLMASGREARLAYEARSVSAMAAQLAQERLDPADGTGDSPEPVDGHEGGVL